MRYKFHNMYLQESTTVHIQSFQTLQYFTKKTYPILSFFPSFSLPDVLCDSTDLIWRDGTPFDAMTGRKIFIDYLLAEVYRDFPQL